MKQRMREPPTRHRPKRRACPSCRKRKVVCPLCQCCHGCGHQPSCSNQKWLKNQSVPSKFAAHYHVIVIHINGCRRIAFSSRHRELALAEAERLWQLDDVRSINVECEGEMSP